MLSSQTFSLANTALQFSLFLLSTVMVDFLGLSSILFLILASLNCAIFLSRIVSTVHFLALQQFLVSRQDLDILFRVSS